MRSYTRIFGIAAVAAATSGLALVPPARADDPVRGSARNITPDDAEEIRDLLEDIVEEALTRDEFDGVVDRLVDHDEHRIGEVGEKEFPVLNERREDIRRTWRAKYNREFDIGDEDVVFRDFAIAQTVADAGDPQDTLRAMVTTPAVGGLPSAKLPVANQKILTVDVWRADINNQINGKELVGNLIAALAKVTREVDAWPADATQAKRYIAAHVIAALANHQFDLDGKDDKGKGAAAQGNANADRGSVVAVVPVVPVVPAAEADKAAQPDRPGQADKGGQANRGRAGKAEKAARAGRPEQAGGTDGAGASGKANRSARAGEPGQAGEAPEGFVLIEERVVVLTANEPQNHFLRAAEYLSKNSPRQAAGEVRIAAAYLDMQASRAKGGTGKQELSGAADELRQAADTIQQLAGQQKGQPQANQQGQQQQVSQVTQAFAQANLALARHFQSLADRAAQNKKAVMAGHDLDAAASALQAAVTWSGQKPEQETLAAIADARRLSMQLLSPAGQPAGAGEGGAQDNAQGDDAAQPAAARVGSGQGQSGGQIPADADKTIDQLASAIQKCGQSIGKSEPGRPQKRDGQGGKPARSGGKGQPDKSDK